MSSFPHLFSPIQVGNYTLDNRIMNTGHAAHFQQGDGTPTSAYAHYVRARARGGVGIIVLGQALPVYDGPSSLGLTMYDDNSKAAYGAIADASHEFDVPVMCQVGHRGRRLFDNVGALARDINAPSAAPTPDYTVPLVMPHEMSTGEVGGLVEAFGIMAERLRLCEFDGVELAVGMDYVFSNFLHPHGNRREDRYGGGTLDERMTFLREVLAITRERLGKGLLIGVRLYDDGVDYSLGMPEQIEIAHTLEREQLVDYINIWQSITSIPREARSHWPSYYYETGAFVGLPAAMKKSGITLPVIGAGRQDSPAVAEQTIANGQADMIGMVKTLIADPDFPNKAKAGRIEDIRTCIACTQSCVGHVDRGLGVGCIYNPVTGREEQWLDLEPARRRQKVMVVGAGPAGMEAARVAAMRGHEVTLIERAARMGGQVNAVMRAPNRGNFEEIILWFEGQLPKLNVTIRLGEEATVDNVLIEAPDVVLVAAGSVPFIPEIAGADLPHVTSAYDVMIGEKPPTGNVLLFDLTGRPDGAATADYLGRSAQVTFLTGMETVAEEMPSPTRSHLLEALMKNPRVSIRTNTSVYEIEPDSLTTFDTFTWEPDVVAGIDQVVIAAGGRADDALYRELVGRHDHVVAIGDCYQPRDIEMSIVHAHRVARDL